MTEVQMEEKLTRVLDNDCPILEKRKLLKELVNGDPENRSVQVAQTTLAEMYLHGKGAVLDYDKAIQMAQNAADHGDAQGMLLIGLATVQKGDVMGSLDWFCKAWIMASIPSEAAVVKLEEMYHATKPYPQLHEQVKGTVDSLATAIAEPSYKEQDAKGDSYFALALYYIYDLNGGAADNLQKAYSNLLKAKEEGHVLADLYLKRKAFIPLTKGEPAAPGASARMMDDRA